MLFCFISISSHPTQPSHSTLSRMRRALRVCKTNPQGDNFHSLFSRSITKTWQMQMHLYVTALVQPVWGCFFQHFLSANSHFSPCLAKLKPVMSLPGADPRPRHSSPCPYVVPAGFWPLRISWAPRSHASSFGGSSCQLLHLGFPQKCL